MSPGPADPESLRILHLEDNASDSALIQHELQKSGLQFTLQRVEDREAFVRALADFRPDLILSDNALPRFDSKGALAVLQDRRAETPFILVSGTVGEERAVEILRSGATDYVLKDRLSRLPSAVQRALEEARARDTLRAKDRELRESVDRFRQLADAMPQIVWSARCDGTIDYYNLRWREFTGFTDSREGIESWTPILHPDDAQSCVNRYRAAVEAGQPYETECRLKDRATGVFRWHLCRALPVKDAEGRIVRWFGTSTDIDDRKRAEQELMRNAFYDPLTSLPNRSLFENRLAKAIRIRARRGEGLFAVLFLDIDRFKLVNDSLGHAAGDKLLAAFARRLESLLRPGDTVARFGGDEFAILIEDVVDANNLTRITDRILEGLGPPFQIEGQEIAATASVGVSLSTTGYDLPEGFLRDADAAMYRAKTLGRARYEIFDAQMHARSVEVLKLEGDLRRALDRSEFVIHYQPIVSLSTGRFTACEALVRWNHPSRGLLSPDKFIPLAEETGLIVPLGAWVLRAACAQMQAWVKQGLSPIDLSVNLSARQLNHNALGATIARALQETGFDARRLKLELTESVLMEYAEQTFATLRELKALGIQLSIDDFGTGYSSLTYLKRIPCTSLKIDRSFVRDVNVDPDDAAIATAIISMAHSLRLKVIAEGIETEDQRSFLKQRDCDEGQGYLFSRPMPAEKFPEVMLAAR